jgi:hypothetical protein
MSYELGNGSWEMRAEDRGTEDTGQGEFGIKNGATGMSDIEHVTNEGMERLGKAT